MTPNAPSSRPLRVLVDAAILKPDLMGIRTYIVGMLSGLARQADVEVVVATSRPEDLEGAGELEVVTLPSGVQDFRRRAVWRERFLDGLVSRTRTDIVLAPVPELPFRRLRVPAIIVVHDVTQILAPALMGRLRWLRATLDLPRATSAASAVVCVSHATLAMLHSTVGVDPTRCVVIPEGPQLLLATDHDEGSLETEPFFLYAGTLLRHKNLPTLLRAFALTDPAIPARLVMVGPASDRELGELHRLREELGLGDRIVHRGLVSTEELGRLYADAVAVVSPSLQEGFGLPLLEAMAAGAPAIVSDLPAFREVGGDAARYVVEPLNPRRWREKLCELAGDVELRRTLGVRGREQARHFTWETVGQRFADLAFSVAGRPR